MKKFILLILGIIFITGCSNNKEQELCNKIDEIDVQSYIDEENYEELSSILEKEYDLYCKNKNSEVCQTLNKYINSTNAEIKIEDCTNKEGSWKEICESNNDLAISEKKINVDYMHEEIWAICNK